MSTRSGRCKWRCWCRRGFGFRFKWRSSWIRRSVLAMLCRWIGLCSSVIKGIDIHFVFRVAVKADRNQSLVWCEFLRRRSRPIIRLSNASVCQFFNGVVLTKVFVQGISIDNSEVSHNVEVIIFLSLSFSTSPYQTSDEDWLEAHDLSSHKEDPECEGA